MKRFILSISLSLALLSSCVCNNDTKSCDKKCDKSCATKVCEVSVADIKSPDQAIAALKAGNERFVSQTMAHPRSCTKRRESTLNSQKPFATIVACSDSRVPVELLFDMGIGDLFVIRTAGNSVASDVVMGSIDYAVEHLNTPVVVILGHQNCGGVTSTITACEEDEAHHKGKLAELINTIRQDVGPYVGHPEKLDEAIRVNADAQVKRIKAVNYIIDKIKRGELKIVSAYYSLETGKVSFDQ